MKTFGLLGPAGTGKTQAGMRLVEGWAADGVRPGEMAYLAFTNAAADEALQRVGGSRETHPYFRTIHSLAYRVLRASRAGADVVTASKMRLFAREASAPGNYEMASGEDLSDIYMSLLTPETEYDVYHRAYALSRSVSRSESDLIAARRRPAGFACERYGAMDEFGYEAWVAKYEHWKRQSNLVDFEDMLELALAHPPLGVDRVIVDEGQDLCPLLHMVVDRLFADAELVWWLGDDDQAIYAFSGASSDLFLDRLSGAYLTVLSQTHRFGAGIVSFADNIIRRVQRRVEKRVVGVPGRAGVPVISGQFEAVPGQYMILHRHRAGCNSVAERFVVKGIPFVNERGYSPMSRAGTIRAFEAVVALSGGGHVSAERAFGLVDGLLPSQTPPDRAGNRVRLVVHGGKKRLEGMPPTDRVTLHDLVRRNVLTTEGFHAVQTRDWPMMKKPGDLAYYQHVVDNGYELGPGGPVITTIHGSKGRQAPHVVVFSEMGRRCWDDVDTETRLAYVAATRTQSDVTICVENTHSWMCAPYSYPC